MTLSYQKPCLLVPITDGFPPIDLSFPKSSSF